LFILLEFLSPSRRIFIGSHSLPPSLVRRIGPSEGSSSGKLVGDAAIWPRAGRLASEGLDEDLHAFPEMQHRVKGGLLLDVVVSKGTTILELLVSKQLTPPRGLRFRHCLRRIILSSKGALIRALVSCPRA
jgi:hypothetical protein